MGMSQSFGEIYNEYFARIYSYTRCRVDSAATAEDITAAVFQKALANSNQFSPSRGNISQWLFGIARNEINYMLRKAAMRRFLPLDLFSDNIPSEQKPDALERQEDSAKLLLALKTLDPREKDLISLKFYSMLNNREIATLTGISESNVGTILYRCMAKLREQFRGGCYENQ